jgi:hypothetical protein
MAVITSCTCHTCGKSWRGAVGSGCPPHTECSECKTKRQDIARREHFGGLDGLSIEERLRRVEEWIYNYKPPRSGPSVF